MIKAAYLFFLSLFFLLAALLALLPDLKSCALSGQKNGRVTPAEWGILALICAAYGFVAFYQLGSRASPATFAEFSPGSELTVELDGEESVAELRLFSGINVGSVSIEFSEDGENYRFAAEFEQKYTSILKWSSLAPDSAVLSAPTRFVRFRAKSGSPRIGEAAFLTANGERITPVTACALTDEAELVRLESSYWDESYFDEIYHVRTAVEQLDSLQPYETSHPPLGKILIGLGIRLFGLTPFGWRFAGTLCGLLMLPFLYFFCRRLFDRRIAACCTLIFAFDFMHFTQTRIATIDSYAVFFILLMYWMMYEYLCAGETRRGRACLALAGLFFGLGAACKWTCLYAGAGLGVIWLFRWCAALCRCESEQRDAVLGAFIKNALFCIIFFVAVPSIIYYLAYIPYGRAAGMSGARMLFSRSYLKLVLDNQSFMFRYHSSVNATHPYSSRWYQWVLDIRPILYYAKTESNAIRHSIAAFVNPALCWGGLLSLFVLAYLALFRRDRRSAFILTGYLAQLVPWMFVRRIVFEYHYFPCTVFLVPALGTVFELIAANDRRWRLPVYGCTALCLALFVLFYPVLSGAGVDGAFADRVLEWLPTWPL